MASGALSSRFDHAMRSRNVHRVAPGSVRIDLPDATQLTDYSCGASALQAICKFYGVGPDEEWQFVERLKMDRRIGSHPFQIIKLAHALGLKTREYHGMTPDQVKRELDSRHPVMLMIQAWGEERVRGKTRARRDYSADWDDGHWVVAIGYDRHGFIFEDPSLELIRGFIAYDDLMTRWRDTGPHGRYMPNYGLAIWHPRRKTSAYDSTAAPIL
jgi:predicted double-glycine peptidase